MTKSIFRSRLASLKPEHWRILRTAGLAAALAHLFVMFRAEASAIRPMDAVLFFSYISITSFFFVGERKYRTGEYACKPVPISTSTQRTFRALVLLSLASFSYGGTLDGTLFWSTAMVAILFQAVVLWVITSGPTREDSTSTTGHLATASSSQIHIEDGAATTSFASAPAHTGVEATTAA